VAFVLEEVAGVVGVYQLAPNAGDFELGVRLEHGTRILAAAHYALLRVLSYEECQCVLFFETGLPPRLQAKAVRLELSAAEREATRARVASKPHGLNEAARPPRVRANACFSALLVDCSSDVYAAVVTALGAGARRVIETDPLVAAEKALSEEFDLILCPARVAFGRNGLLCRIHEHDSFAASRVVLIASPGEHALVMANLDELGCFNTCLSPPVEPEMLLELARTGCVVLPFTIPIPVPRPESGGVQSSKATERSILVIDDDIGTRILVVAMGNPSMKMTVTDDAWEALDQLAASTPDLILCSASLRVGRVPLYRLLWGAHPELKSRFVLIVPRDDLTPSAIQGRERPIVRRPLTREIVQWAMERFGAAR
jgi:hypothetical protein